MDSEQRYTMKVVSRRSQLSPHVIRAWERRHDAVQPLRTPTNRRLYSERDVERLNLLRRLCEAGHSISQIAGLESAELEALLQVEGRQVSEGLRAGDFPTEGAGAAVSLRGALAAIHRLDSAHLRTILRHATVNLNQVQFIDQFLAPLIEEIGSLWHQGRLSTAQEHLASATIRTYLGHLIEDMGDGSGSPTMVIATPSGQHHELGALLVGLSAAAAGCRPIYVGPDLPAAEISRVARESRSRAVALSIVYPEDDAGLARQLRELKKTLAEDTVILAGGRAASAYDKALDRIGARRFANLAEFRDWIQTWL